MTLFTNVSESEMTELHGDFQKVLLDPQIFDADKIATKARDFEQDNKETRYYQACTKRKEGQQRGQQDLQHYET